MSTVTLGGDRLGSGNKNKIHMRNYERSTHDLSHIWRSTMASGTLVPFLKQLALPGDTWDIDLNMIIKTHPTWAPLFGSYKLQLDVFLAPVRLYNAMLHNNALGIGMNMASVKLPQIEINAGRRTHDDGTIAINRSFINESSLFKYLGISGTGNTLTGVPDAKRKFNALPILAYWDIFKNYYANKQEKLAYVIGSYVPNSVLSFEYKSGSNWINAINTVVTTAREYRIVMEVPTNVIPDQIYFEDSNGLGHYGNIINFSQNNETLLFKLKGDVLGRNVKNASYSDVFGDSNVKLAGFPLENIDDMRETLLSAGKQQVIIDDKSMLPYSASLQWISGSGATRLTSASLPQSGLAVKTYQSDLYNNWLSKEWVDGVGGINEITAISTAGGSFSIDTLNLSNKVYNMLNRIAVSGGSYKDWISAVYDHSPLRAIESPMYMGGASQEIFFDEIIAQAGTTENELGSLAGTGTNSGKKKGGSITIRVDEPSYILGIVSITPRIDYSQGNDWDMNLKNMDDFHKPGLDGIGFQDLITDQMCWEDTIVDVNGIPTFKSAGKVPAWVNYMTAVNKVYGNFADENKEMYMTLNRRYEVKHLGNGLGMGIKDLTTYIDPTKFNYMWAVNDLSAQNFWVQIGCDITARRKMSAKIMPNL